MEKLADHTRALGYFAQKVPFGYLRTTKPSITYTEVSCKLQTSHARLYRMETHKLNNLFDLTRGKDESYQSIFSIPLLLQFLPLLCFSLCNTSSKPTYTQCQKKCLRNIDLNEMNTVNDLIPPPHCYLSCLSSTELTNNHKTSSIKCRWRMQLYENPSHKCQRSNSWLLHMPKT